MRTAALDLEKASLPATIHDTARGAEQSYDVDFATFFGGALYEHARDICVDNAGSIYVVGGTTSMDLPTTPGAYDRTFNGHFDIFVCKFDPNGSLVWSTYVGSPHYDRAYAVEVDNQGYVYVGGRGGRYAPVTPGSLQTTFKGEWEGGPYQSDMNAYLFKLSPAGALLASTFVSGSDEENPDGISVDPLGNVFVCGYTKSSDFPGTGTALRNTYRGDRDGVLFQLSADFNDLEYSTYMSGSASDDLRASCLDSAGNIYVTGESGSADWPTRNAYQDYLGGQHDVIIAKFSPGNTTVPPTAVARATPTTGPAPLVVTFDGNGSSDPDGMIVSYDWDFGPATGSGQTTSYTYTVDGTYKISLTVTDDQGARDTDTVDITVGTPPVLNITRLFGFQTIDVGEQEYYTAHHAFRGHEDASPVVIGDPVYSGTHYAEHMARYTFVDGTTPIDTGGHFVGFQQGNSLSVPLTGDSTPRTIRAYLAQGSFSSVGSITVSAGSAAPVLNMTVTGQEHLYEVELTFTGSTTLRVTANETRSMASFSLAGIVVPAPRALDQSGTAAAGTGVSMPSRHWNCPYPVPALSFSHMPWKRNRRSPGSTVNV